MDILNRLCATDTFHSLSSRVRAAQERVLRTCAPFRGSRFYDILARHPEIRPLGLLFLSFLLGLWAYREAESSALSVWKSTHGPSMGSLTVSLNSWGYKEILPDKNELPYKLLHRTLELEQNLTHLNSQSASFRILKNQKGYEALAVLTSTQSLPRLFCRNCLQITSAGERGKRAQLKELFKGDWLDFGTGWEGFDGLEASLLKEAERVSSKGRPLSVSPWKDPRALNW